MSDDLQRTLGKLEATLDLLSDRLSQIDHTIRNHQQALQAASAFGPRIDSTERRLTALEEGRNWFVKTVGAIIIAAVLSIVVIKTGIPFPSK